MSLSIKSIIGTIYHCFKSPGILNDKNQKTNEKVQAHSLKSLENLAKVSEELTLSPSRVLILNKKGEFFTAKGIQALYYRYLTNRTNASIINQKINKVINSELRSLTKDINESLEKQNFQQVNQELRLFFSSVEKFTGICSEYTGPAAKNNMKEISNGFKYAIEGRIDKSQFDELDISLRFSQEKYAASKVLKELKAEGLYMSEETTRLLLSSSKIPFYLKVALQESNGELQEEHLDLERSNLDEVTKFKSEADKKIDQMKENRDKINEVLHFFNGIGINIYSKLDRRKMHDKKFWTAERKKGFDKINATIYNFKDFFPVVFLTGCEKIHSFTPGDDRDQTQTKYPTFYNPGGKNFHC